MYTAIVVLALVGSALCDAPYPAAKVHTEYGVPHEVYGPPTLRIEPVKPINTEYKYDVFTPKKVIDFPYEARVEKPHLEYGPPIVVNPYPARIEKPYPARVEQPHVEYGVPHAVYGPPTLRIEPVKPVLTEYKYEVHTPKKVVEFPYPARVEKPHLEYGPPIVVNPYPARIEKPYPARVEQPHVEYGVPHEVYGPPTLRIEPVKPVHTEYKYEVYTPKKVVDFPYPARVEKPHLEYGPPIVVNPYPARIEKPHVEYGVPHDVYGPPTLRIEPVKPIHTEYKYEVHTPKKVVDFPYPARVEKPHLEYGPPIVVNPYPARIEKPYPARVEMPHVEYGVPHEVYGPPTLRIEPVKPIHTEYKYEVHTPKKVVDFPYPARVEKPHLEYGPPKPYTAPIKPAEVYGLF